MVNVTLAVRAETLQRARIKALEEGTSVNAVVRSFLEAYVSDDTRATSIQRFLELSDQAGGGIEGAGRTWSRQDIYGDRAEWQRS